MSLMADLRKQGTTSWLIIAGTLLLGALMLAWWARPQPTAPTTSRTVAYAQLSSTYPDCKLGNQGDLLVSCHRGDGGFVAFLTLPTEGAARNDMITRLAGLSGGGVRGITDQPGWAGTAFTLTVVSLSGR